MPEILEKPLHIVAPHGALEIVVNECSDDDGEFHTFLNTMFDIRERTNLSVANRRSITLTGLELVSIAAFVNASQIKELMPKFGIAGRNSELARDSEGRTIVCDSIEEAQKRIAELMAFYNVGPATYGVANIRINKEKNIYEIND